jgi:hypothetical protein
MSKKITTQEFIERAKSKWGSRYDYSRVDYVNMKTKVSLFCENKHMFSISPGNLLRGKGCSYCLGRNNLVNSLEKFISIWESEYKNKLENNDW